MEINNLQQQNIEEIQTLQDVILKLSEQPQLHAFGQRKLNPLKTFENRYTWITIRTALEQAQKIGSSLLYLQQQDQISDEDFQIGIIASNTVDECILNLACVMYNIPQVYFENELTTIELKTCVKQINMQVVFGCLEELKKLKETQLANNVKLFAFDIDNLSKIKLENVDDFNVLEKLGQENRSQWRDCKQNSLYAKFFDIEDNFKIISKTQQQLLNDLKNTKKKLMIKQTKSLQGTYLSLNGSGNYYEHVFRLFNMTCLFNRIALPSLYQNYFTDLYIAQPTIILANFSANYSQIHRDQQNGAINFQKQLEKLKNQKNGFLKNFIKGFFYQTPQNNIQYKKVQHVISINEAKYHDLQGLLENCVDVQEAHYQRILNFLQHDNIYTNKDVEFKDMQNLKMKASDDQGLLVLKNNGQKNEILKVGKIENNDVYLQGDIDDFIELSNGDNVSAREIESFYRNQNPFIQDLYVTTDENKNLIAILDINDLTQQLGVNKDQNKNKNFIDNTLNLLEKYRSKNGLEEEKKITKFYAEQVGFRQRNLMDKFDRKRYARFHAFYSKELNELKSNKQQFYLIININL